MSAIVIQVLITAGVVSVPFFGWLGVRRSSGASETGRAIEAMQAVAEARRVDAEDLREQMKELRAAQRESEERSDRKVRALRAEMEAAEKGHRSEIRRLWETVDEITGGLLTIVEWHRAGAPPPPPPGMEDLIKKASEMLRSARRRTETGETPVVYYERTP